MNKEIDTISYCCYCGKEYDIVNGYSDEFCSKKCSDNCEHEEEMNSRSKKKGENE